MREIALVSGKIYTAGTNFTRPLVVTVASRDGRDKSQFCPSKISTFQVVLQFNRGTSDPDGDGNFDCIPAVDNFQVSLKKAKKTRMKITFYIAL